MLGWIEPDENIAFLAERGGMFLLFRVGLEVKLSDLKQVGGTGSLVGVLRRCRPIHRGWVLLRLWGRPQKESLLVGRH